MSQSYESVKLSKKTVADNARNGNRIAHQSYKSVKRSKKTVVDNARKKTGLRHESHYYLPSKLCVQLCILRLKFHV